MKFQITDISQNTHKNLLKQMKLLFILYLIKNENKISKNLDITNENSFDLEKQKKKNTK